MGTLRESKAWFQCILQQPARNQPWSSLQLLGPAMGFFRNTDFNKTAKYCLKNVNGNRIALQSSLDYWPDISDADFTAEFAEDFVLDTIHLFLELLQLDAAFSHAITDWFYLRLYIRITHTTCTWFSPMCVIKLLRKRLSDFPIASFSCVVSLHLSSELCHRSTAVLHFMYVRLSHCNRG